MHASAAKTANFTTTGVDITNRREVCVHTVLSAVSGTTPRMILEIETSYDNTNWVHLKHIVDETTAGDNVTTTGDADRGKLKATGTCVTHISSCLGKYIRLKGTISGTTPSFTFTCYGSAG